VRCNPLPFPARSSAINAPGSKATPSPEFFGKPACRSPSSDPLRVKGAEHLPKKPLVQDVNLFSTASPLVSIRAVRSESLHWASLFFFLYFIPPFFCLFRDIFGGISLLTDLYPPLDVDAVYIFSYGWHLSPFFSFMDLFR